jgi:hypothetical protein
MNICFTKKHRLNVGGGLMQTSFISVRLGSTLLGAWSKIVDEDPNDEMDRERQQRRRANALLHDALLIEVRRRYLLEIEKEHMPGRPADEPVGVQPQLE